MSKIEISDNDQSSSTTMFFKENYISGEAQITPHHTSTGGTGEISSMEIWKSIILQQEEQKNRITAIERKISVTSDFYKSASSTNTVARIVIIILMVIPIIQIIVCAGIVYHLGIQANLPGLLTWGLSGIGLISLAEVILVPVQFYLLKKKVDDIEKEVEKDK